MRRRVELGSHDVRCSSSDWTIWVAIIDYNKIQSLTSIEGTLGLEPFVDKLKSFGWSVVETEGHDHGQLHGALSTVPAQPTKPTCILAHTTKGKSVSFMENSVLWHYRTAQGEEYAAALKQLEEVA